MVVMSYTSVRLLLVGFLLCIPWYVGFELAQRHPNTQQTTIQDTKITQDTALQPSQKSIQQASVHTTRNSISNESTVHHIHQILSIHHEKNVAPEPLQTNEVDIEDTAMLLTTPSSKTTQKMGIVPGAANEKFSINEILNAQNIARAEVGVPSLFWSTSLAQSAQEWGDTLASQGCTLSHDSNSDYGENLASRWVTTSSNSGLISSPKEIVSLWTDEKQFYDYFHNLCKDGELCGHYTQLVWKESTEVGCAVSTCFDASTQKQTDVWTCRYNPPGNIQGKTPY